MKKQLLFYFLLLISYLAVAQAVAINTTGTPPDASAILDVSSTTKGMLVPRMTTAQRNAIGSSATGLMVYDLTTNSFWYKSVSNWIEVVDTLNNVWKKNGVNAYLGPTGNAGIGTSTPGYDLHIYRANPSIGFFDVDDNHSSGFITGDSSNLEIAAYRKSSLGTNEAGNLILQANSSGFPSFFAGNVGIGKRDPYYKLSLNGDLGLYNGSSVYGTMQHQSDDLWLNAGLGSSLGNSNPNNLILQYEDGLFTTSGLVGIATAAPLSKLHIGTGADVSLASHGYLMLGSVSSTNLIFDNNEIGLRNNGAWGELAIQNDGGTVRIGNVAVPTGYKFAINGKAIMEELKVQLAGNWPDYVFKKDYKLKSFDELRNFISQNHHLPNIPSAKEIESSGIEVGDMQKRMMEKIEELTLYVLQLHKEIELLKSNKPQK